MRCYLIRHAQTEANAQGLLSCEHAECLNAVGRVQAGHLRDYLLKLDFDALWVSPLTRAIATIQPYCEATGCGYEAMPMLAEGRFNLNPNAEIADPVYSEDGLPLRDESVESFRGRVRQFINLLLSDNSDRSIVVVTHGQFIREFLNMLLGASRYVRWPVGNCSETLVEFADDVFIRHVNRVVVD